MPKLKPVDVSQCSLDIHRDLSIEPRKRKPGPPERIDGMTVGIFTLTEDAPHDGECILMETRSCTSYQGKSEYLAIRHHTTL